MLKELSIFRKIGQKMLGQDNRITAHPIFMVQEKKRIYGVDLNWTDDYVWCDDEGIEVATDQEELRSYLRDEGLEQEYIDKIENDADILYDYGLHMVGYLDTWVAVQPFFSQKGADEYIEANKHNLKEPRVYVESAYRNKEWQAARALLIELGELDEEKEDAD